MLSKADTVKIQHNNKHQRTTIYPLGVHRLLSTVDNTIKCVHKLLSIVDNTIKGVHRLLSTVDNTIKVFTGCYLL